MTEQKQELKGYVHSLESFGSVDGPGVRYVIFLTGCAMRCQFCHNPDTWNMRAGTLYTAEELLKQALRYRTYWGNEGGITVSGGEPLLQIDFLIELFKKAKEQGVHTTLDTSGNPFTREEPFFGKVQELMKYTDLVMLDIKEIEEDRHQLLTGHTNANIPVSYTHLKGKSAGDDGDVPGIFLQRCLWKIEYRFGNPGSVPCAEEDVYKRQVYRYDRNVSWSSIAWRPCECDRIETISYYGRRI